MKRFNERMICLLGVAILFLASSCGNQCEGTLYIDAPRVFEGFNLTQELKEKTKLEEKKFSSSIDSLKLAITINSDTDSEKYRRMSFRLSEMEKARDYHLTDLISESDDRIWNVLNGYFKEFGELRKCNVLLAGTGNGNVLYVSSKVDVTEDFIEFSNKKYEGE